MKEKRTERGVGFALKIVLGNVGRAAHVCSTII